MGEASRTADGSPSTSDATEPSRVLVVDDEPVVVLAVRRALGTTGLVVEGAENGLQAATLLKQRRYDAIISDIAMPGMDGIQLLKAVSQHTPNVPVILMTGGPTLETAIKAVEYGAFRYLLKPFDIEVLVDLVGKAIRLSRLVQLRREAASLLGTEDRQLGDRVSLEAAFESALATLWMAYQPIASWRGRSIFAFEALVRTAEPTIPHPGALLEAAERLGRLQDLGRTTRERVAAMVPTAPSECVFVNLHTLDLLDDELYSSRAPLSRVASRVVLEITERVALDDVPDTQDRVARLRKLGFRLAIDDLGAGYAGLTAFAHLEPEVVKFDMSLVRGLDQKPTQRKLVTSMAALFKEMGLQVVAEGVETIEELDAVTQAGCDLIQGYLLARPGKPFPTVSWPAL